MSDKPSYNVNLPQTNFPMKANSAVREVDIERTWEENKVYEQSLDLRKAGPKYVLHDGPPYLSAGKIHIGHALNKILKDIVTKYKSQQGFYSPYVPGYDSHGLPIENAVLKEVKGGRSAFSPLELRKRCREFALKNLKGQEENFKRLGVWGHWEKPYVTLDSQFEAAQIRVFGTMADRGHLYKGLKPVYWCANCETALAEAEVEYADHVSDSVYVKFELDSESRAKLPNMLKSKAASIDLNQEKVSLVIWTTTPWTLPANLGISLNPEFTYLFLSLPDHGVIVVAEELKDAFFAACGLEPAQADELGRLKGKELENFTCRHPFIDRASLVMVGDHVTAEAGTGCVHTAPGHGLEDFEVGNRYKIGVVSPLDNRGVFTEEAGDLAGTRYDKANSVIIEKLKELGALIGHDKYSHSYPHCWRCHKPVIYRATEQWFASVDGFRQDALKAIDTVTWLPESGRNRIYNMIENRSDWCISRQRAWGVPIPVFYCQSCHEPLMTAKSVETVACVFEKEGSDSWWENEANHFLGDKFSCAKCGGKKFDKEMDIMDVWFDSGSTHAAVLDVRPELKGTPCELYLEGSDQHRGWFQSSMLTSVATKGRAPYKTVLTHGFVLDENGRKMSKSLGNVVDPNDVIKQYGADVLRLWVASVNYADDVHIGKNMLAQLADVYRKLRNTARYMLGNLYDFDPVKDKVKYDELSKLDQYMLHKLQEVVKEVTEDFDRFQFFKYYQLLQNFCVVELSSFYFDIVKDTLYTSPAKSLERRARQTVLEEILLVLVRLLVPVTPHLAEDIWQHLPEKIKEHVAQAGFNTQSVLLTDFPKPNNAYRNEKIASFFEELMPVRYTVNKALELARANRSIGSSLEAKVLLKVDNEQLVQKLQSLDDELSTFFITSQTQVGTNFDAKSLNGNCLAENADSELGLAVFVLQADGSKCPRCWKFSQEIGKDNSHPDLCHPCAQAEKKA